LFADAVGGDCPYQENWSEIYPHVARQDDPPEKRREAEQYLATQNLQCGKLKLRPDSCHGCPDNPRGDERRELNRRRVGEYGDELRRAERLHRLTRWFRLDLADLEPLDLEMLLEYDREYERARIKAGVKF